MASNYTGDHGTLTYGPEGGNTVIQFGVWEIHAGTGPSPVWGGTFNYSLENTLNAFLDRPVVAVGLFSSADPLDSPLRGEVELKESHPKRTFFEAVGPLTKNGETVLSFP